MSEVLQGLQRGTIGRYASAPAMVKALFWTAMAWAVLTILAALALVPHADYVATQLISANNRAKTKRTNYPAGALQDAKNSMDPRLLVSGLTALILILLAIMVLRASRFAKWALVLMATILPFFFPFGTGIILQLLGGISSTGAPLLYRGSLILAGLCSLAVTVMMFMPATKDYYRQSHPVNPDVVARPSLLGSLFRPGAVRATSMPSSQVKSTNRAANRAKSKAGVIDVDSRPDSGSVPDDQSTRPSTGRRTATRPGSVRPKSAGPRSKSRNQ